jgi:drug/metabolite transporter (DMT)-like permease
MPFVAALGPLGYILVLWAMTMAPVSHVAPARELATLVGTYFGGRLLKERIGWSRLAGALCSWKFVAEGGNTVNPLDCAVCWR